MQQRTMKLKTQEEQPLILAKCLPCGRNSTHTNLFHPHNRLCIWHYYPHHIDEETEIQRGRTDCPRAQSSEEDPRFKPWLLHPKSPCCLPGVSFLAPL